MLPSHYVFIIVFLAEIQKFQPPSPSRLTIYSQNKEILNSGQTFFKILRDKNTESQLLKHPSKTNQHKSSKTYLKRYFHADKGYQNRDVGKLFLFQFINNI